MSRDSCFSRLRHGVCTLWGVVCYCVLCDVMFVSTHVFAAIPRGGGGAGKHFIFLFERRSRELF